MKYTPEQLSWFAAYEEVRDSGKWNMFDSRAMRAAGLAQEEYMFVMSNYSALKAEADAANNV